MDVFDAEEEAERAVAQMAVLVGPVLAPFPPAVRRTLLARVLARVAMQEAFDALPVIVDDAEGDDVPLADDPPPRRRLVQSGEGTLKAKIVAFVEQHPGAAVSQVADAVYGNSETLTCNKARALLHQLASEGVLRVASRAGSPGLWEAVPLAERTAALAGKLAKALKGGAAV